LEVAENLFLYFEHKFRGGRRNFDLIGGTAYTPRAPFIEEDAVATMGREELLRLANESGMPHVIYYDWM